ncbi:LUD domain-containing protein, partial [Aeromonas dhakensis]
MSEHAKYSPRRFQPQAEAALADPVLRQNFRGAMDYLRAKRRDAFADPREESAVRDAAEQIRQRCLSRLPDLLEQLEANCERNGIRVHWAQTPDEANAIILRIAQKHGVSSIVKGKSMVSEEVGFNHEMARHGIRCLESDMGEFIVQLDGDTPSHIIMPAIHKNKQEVSDTFA